VPARSWVTAGLPPGTFETLAGELPASRLWSLLLEVVEARATVRRPAALMEQWERDRFVQPAGVDQRVQLAVDSHLLAAVPEFEGIELSPVAPLGVCAAMGHASQNKVLSALRGTEVVSDPTNVMALECARRLRADPTTRVRLATVHRCVRAQSIPPIKGFAAHFRIFCLASAGMERQNHAFVVDAIVEQMGGMLRALDVLEQHGYAFPNRRITVLTTADKTAVGDRIELQLGSAGVTRATLDHAYYDRGVRFQISARSNEGVDIPLIDGGAFDWLAKLASHRGATYVASGLGAQLVPLLFKAIESSCPAGS
jgi:hypothetical protein